jgi:hypothetical protein
MVGKTFFHCSLAFTIDSASPIVSLATCALSSLNTPKGEWYKKHTSCPGEVFVLACLGIGNELGSAGDDRVTHEHIFSCRCKSLLRLSMLVALYYCLNRLPIFENKIKHRL